MSFLSPLPDAFDDLWLTTWYHYPNKALHFPPRSGDRRFMLLHSFMLTAHTHRSFCSGYLETATFVPTAFEATMSSSSAFEESVDRDLQVFCDPCCQQLYSDVTMTREQLRDRNDVASGFNIILHGCTFVGMRGEFPPSWNPHPVSILCYIMPAQNLVVCAV